MSLVNFFQCLPSSDAGNNPPRCTLYSICQKQISGCFFSLNTLHLKYEHSKRYFAYLATVLDGVVMRISLEVSFPLCCTFLSPRWNKRLRYNKVQIKKLKKTVKLCVDYKKFRIERARSIVTSFLWFPNLQCQPNHRPILRDPNPCLSEQLQ
jgi:hypothetical protein